MTQCLSEAVLNGTRRAKREKLCKVVKKSVSKELFLRNHLKLISLASYFCSMFWSVITENIPQPKWKKKN